jgi:hexosaminidase
LRLVDAAGQLYNSGWVGCWRDNLACMRKLILKACLIMMAFSLRVSTCVEAQSPSVIPIPLSTVEKPGSLRIHSGEVVSYDAGDAEAKFSAEHFVDLVARTRGIKLVAVAGKKDAAIEIVRSGIAGIPRSNEDYDVDVSPSRVTISAWSDAGLFYGTVTLWQLMTATDAESGPAELHCMHIHDEPQLKWRGIMLDSARHMQSIEFIRQLIDWMSLEKLNVLHWHLTDDQGWRLEIKRYPKLTTVGAWRQLYSPTGQMGGPAGITKEELRYGGYYSQAQVRALVAYARQRNVMIVPEIEMPGHATAALAAYPEYGSTKTPPTAPSSKHGILPNLYNVNEDTFAFIDNILLEVMELFPSPYIHIGGDEAVKDQWKASPEIQAKMKALGVANEDQLQSYFVKRVDAFITAHGRHTLGWDEILQGGLAPGAAVMSWHGVQGGMDAAKSGHDAVLASTRPLYLNYRQSDLRDEAPGRWALNTLENVYNFNPSPSTLTAEQKAHILGVEGSLWTEYVIDPPRIEWMVFPRAAALGEIGWSSTDHRNWNDFLVRMVAENHRFRELGINFDPAIFRVRSTEKIVSGMPEMRNEKVQVTLSNQANFAEIHYTTDGSAVTAESPKYETSLMVALPARLRAAAFEGKMLDGSELDRKLDSDTVRLRMSPELTLCSTSPVIGMEQDPPQPSARPVSLANYQHPCWIYKDADLSTARSISAGVMSLPYLFAERSPTPPTGNPVTKSGELEVHLDTCEGKVLTILPFAPAVGRIGVIKLDAALPQTEGTHDLCMKVVRPDVNPLWVVDWVEVDPKLPQ